MQIRCEKCSAVSDAAMPETYLEGDVELTFLRCPSCGEVYPVCATDSALRKDIAEYKEMRSAESGLGRLLYARRCRMQTPI